MTWIQTYTGRKFDLADPDPDQVDLADIAHAISMLCRFTGHVRDFYSVAQHSVIVSNLVPAEHAFAGLMHDATEAYVADLNRPLKNMLPEYKLIERAVWEAIAGKFGLDVALPAEVKEADNVALLWERRDLLGEPPHPWEMEHLTSKVPSGLLLPMTHREAEDAFLTRFHMLLTGCVT